MAITIGEIHESIHKGTREANGIYERWSNGCWLSDSGVEGLLVCEIARQLYKKQGERESLLLELPFSKIQEWSGARRPPATLGGQNRADIVLLDGEEKPKFVIEVKRSWDNQRCLDDLKRIRELVRTYPNIKRGFLAAFLAYPVPNGGVQEKIREIEEFVGDRFNNRGVDVKFSGGEIIEWTGRRVWQISSLSVEVSARR